MAQGIRMMTRVCSSCGKEANCRVMILDGDPDYSLCPSCLAAGCGAVRCDHCALDSFCGEEYWRGVVISVIDGYGYALGFRISKLIELTK